MAGGAGKFPLFSHPSADRYVLCWHNKSDRHSFDVLNSIKLWKHPFMMSHSHLEDNTVEPTLRGAWLTMILGQVLMHLCFLCVTVRLSSHLRVRKPDWTQSCMCLHVWVQIAVRSLFLHTTRVCCSFPCFPTTALTTELSHKEANHHQSDWAVEWYHKGTALTHQHCTGSPCHDCL